MLRLFAVLLTLVFVVAQISHYITWSWWVVFSPMLVVFGVPIVFWLTAAFFAGIITLIVALFYKD
jgi:hypothetical protein